MPKYTKRQLKKMAYQTLLYQLAEHRPNGPESVDLEDAASLIERCSFSVIYDFAGGDILTTVVDDESAFEDYLIRTMDGEPIGLQRLVRDFEDPQEFGSFDIIFDDSMPRRVHQCGCASDKCDEWREAVKDAPGLKGAPDVPRSEY